LPLFLFGGGTNLLVGDGGIRGIVLALGRPFRRTRWSETADGMRVYAGAAARFAALVRAAARRGLSGLEFAEGIPGSLGGGLRMNAGAFGGEISQVLHAVHGIDAGGDECRLQSASLRHGYRFYDLPAGFVVTALEFDLRRDTREAIAARIATARRRRGEHQPSGHPCAGSVFKNPPGASAGRLIESVGLKGRRVGDAMVSPRHCNFIVNMGAARAGDVRRLMEEIEQTVWRERAVRLVPEIRLVGDWGSG